MFVWAAIPDGYTNSADYVMELLIRLVFYVHQEAASEALEKVM